jgi:DNA helicase HerA-like ATPase
MTDMTPTPAALSDVVGHVDGSEPVTTGSFMVVLDQSADVQLDDLVMVRTSLPSGGEVRNYGIIGELYGSLDGATIPSDTPRIAAAEMPGELCRRAEVTVLRVDPERYIPPQPGAVVRLARGYDRALALFEDQMGDAKLVLGVDQSGEPVNVDFRYLDGSQGAHVSISGVSGVAAKTSFAMGVLYSLFETTRGKALLGANAPHARGLVFNVKGEDLLFLDRPNTRFVDHPEATAQWQAMGVEAPGPFSDVRFYAPCRGRDGEIIPDITSRAVGDVAVFGWTPQAFIRQGLLPFLFGEREDRGTQVDFVEQRVRLQLARYFRPLVGGKGAVVMVDTLASTSSDFDRVVSAPHDEVPDGAGFVVRDLGDLVDYIATKVDPAHADPDWTAGAQSGTLSAFLRRLFAQNQRVGHLIRVGLEPINYERRISVVDIHGLHDSAQRFVVGALLSKMFKEKRGREPLRFVVLDELNKYCPKEGQSPIKEVIVDIASRGRSLGVILIGAQQSASTVDPMVTTNAAIKVVGRVDAGEVDTYRFLSSALRDRASRFLPGTMILSQPLVPAPIPIRVPFPPFATNVGEAEMELNPKVAKQVADILGN